MCRKYYSSCVQQTAYHLAEAMDVEYQPQCQSSRDAGEYETVSKCYSVDAHPRQANLVIL